MRLRCRVLDGGVWFLEFRVWMPLSRAFPRVQDSRPSVVGLLGMQWLRQSKAFMLPKFAACTSRLGC